jgi:hypothetical protein
VEIIVEKINICALKFSRYCVVKTHILIELMKDNPFHDDTTADEKYQFTCMIDFRHVFRDGANVERINFRGGIVDMNTI